jgi:hypothetical protein
VAPEGETPLDGSGLDTERFGVPTTPYALLDRRPRDEQEREPYVLGEVVELRGDAPGGEE